MPPKPWNARSISAAVLMLVGGMLVPFGGCGGALAWYHYGTDAAVPLTDVTADELIQTRPDRWVPHYRVELTVRDEHGPALARRSYEDDLRFISGVEESSDVLLISKDPLPAGRQQLIVRRYDKLLVGCEGAFEQLGTSRDDYQAFAVGDRRAGWQQESQRAGWWAVVGGPLGAMMFVAGVMVLRTRRRTADSSGPPRT